MKSKKFSAFLLIAALFVGTASASGISHQVGNWQYGTYYCPHEGTATAYHDPLETTTEVYFSYTNANDLFKIQTENNKGNYVGLDIKDRWYVVNNREFVIGASFDAYMAVSSLPNEKTDLEINSYGSSHHDEADVVALGALELNKDYYFTVVWNDLRKGDIVGLQGTFSISSELSEKGVSDYNTIEWQSHVNIDFPGVKGTGYD